MTYVACLISSVHIEVLSVLRIIIKRLSFSGTFSLLSWIVTDREGSREQFAFFLVCLKFGKIWQYAQFDPKRHCHPFSRSRNVFFIELGGSSEVHPKVITCDIALVFLLSLAPTKLGWERRPPCLITDARRQRVMNRIKWLNYSFPPP